MQTQEVMLNDNLNLNFKYKNKVFKIRVNIHNGLIVVEELHKNNEDIEVKQVISLAELEPCEYTIQEEIKEIEEQRSKEEPNDRRKNNRPKSKKTRKNNKR